MPQYLDIKQYSNEGISNFQISGQSFIKENCDNSRTGNDIDMKLGPVTKLKKTKHDNVKKLDDDKMFINCDITVILSIYEPTGAIQKLDSGCTECKIYISKTVTFYFTKIESSIKQSLTAPILLLRGKVLFFTKTIHFFVKKC